ncbi:MAG: hypothetical protein IJO63_04405 [Bacilli bacterium]|nr:hypothetical protein [Bacilli bacterium]
MFGPKELDIRNVYNPNLESISESAERTYGEANSFYRKEELYLQDIERRLLSGELSSEKDIYDECHAIASDLAKCCEIYLKALYIYEHNISGTIVDELWEKLKKSEFQTDDKGNLLYVTLGGVITFVKYDENEEPIKDANGSILYFDKNNNAYTENNRGAKIKRSGHQLDRLIEALSPESRILLETRMLTIPMEETENNHSVSILDVLLEKGILPRENQISFEQYVGWIEQHKKTFEESRYSGQKQFDVNVEFLYHLATQIKALAQYTLDPQNDQKFTMSDDDFCKLPSVTKQVALLYPHLISEELLKFISNDSSAKAKIQFMFSSEYNLPLETINHIVFFKMIKLMDINEIGYTLYLCYLIQNLYNENALTSADSIIQHEKVSEMAEFLGAMGYTPNKVIRLFVQIKETFGKSVHLGNTTLKGIFKLLINKVFGRYYDQKKYDISKLYKETPDPDVSNDYLNDYNNYFSNKHML